MQVSAPRAPLDRGLGSCYGVPPLSQTPLASTTLLGESRSLSDEEAFALCGALLDGEFTNEQAAQILISLAERGETAAELHGFVRCLLSRSLPVPFEQPTFDTCGTGGSGLVRFNVSTAVAFLLAASGVVVAKHGNRGTRAPNGSFDLLEALGIPVELDAEAVAHCLERTGQAFLYARTFHPALRGIAEPRALAARRTIFNLAGPLSNPTRVRGQVVGTPSGKDARLVASCLHLLGRSGVVIVGHGGLDDVDLSGPAQLIAAGEQAVVSELNPAALGIAQLPVSELPGGNAQTNAELFELLLDDRAPESLRQLVCLSASVALVAAGRAPSYADGYEFAHALLRDGQAKAQFLEYRAVARACAKV